jgi:hypothetical protein
MTCANIPTDAIYEVPQEVPQVWRHWVLLEWRSDTVMWRM